MLSGSSLLLQIWVCATPVLATLLFAPMLVCAQPGVWLSAPVAAIVRAATPAQIAQFRSTRPDAPVSTRRTTRPLAHAKSVTPVHAFVSYPVAILAVAFCQASPRAP